MAIGGAGGGALLSTAKFSGEESPDGLTECLCLTEERSSLLTMHCERCLGVSSGEAPRPKA